MLQKMQSLITTTSPNTSSHMHCPHKYIFVGLILSVLCSLSLACSCIRGQSLQDKIQEAKSVFRGQVVNKKQVEANMFFLVRVTDACRLLQRDPAQEIPDQGALQVTVRTGTHSCGVTNLEVGKEYTFLAGEQNEISLCGWEGSADWNIVKDICNNTPVEQDVDAEVEIAGDDDALDAILPLLGRYPHPRKPRMTLKRVEREICGLCRRLRHRRHPRRHRRRHPRRDEREGREEPAEVNVEHELVDPIPSPPLAQEGAPQTPPPICNCTKVLHPICSRDAQGNLRTFPNACMALCHGTVPVYIGQCKQADQEGSESIHVFEPQVETASSGIPPLPTDSEQ
mmetsp:Transcript_8224/g.30374  ORF Transcript_8224/g.30374 Transcript_8224/m.30374 type:complete len:340 (+) Transcript_8224:4421-5440(+)